MTEIKRVSSADGVDITEGLQVMLDALYNSMDAGSGFLDYREWCAIRQVAHALGLDPDEFSDPEYKLIDGTFTADFRHPNGNPGYTRTPPVTTYWPDPTAPLTDEPNDEQNHAAKLSETMR